MIRIHRGRGGWAASRRALARAAGGAIVALALVLFGCSSQTSPAAGQGAAGQPGMGESGVGGAGGNSLSQYQKGTLGQNQGPLSDIHFGFNEYSIRSQDSQILQNNADWMMKHPNSRVEIEGNCDDRGSEEYNIALGARRAQAAKDYLETLGIASERMSTISYGKELPLCTEQTEQCWAENRRDHFAVSQ